MALNPSGAISLAGPSTGQSIAVELGQSATATISLNDTNVRTLAGVVSGVIVMPTDFWGKSNITSTQKAIFAFGNVAPFPLVNTSVSNLVSSTGAVATDTPGVGTPRGFATGTTYGGDKAIFAFGQRRVPSPAINYSMSNLVSNTGVVASDTPATPGTTARIGNFATTYGSSGQAVYFNSLATIANYVSNTGVVASDTSTGITKVYGNGASADAGASYGGDKGITAFGFKTGPFSLSNSKNLISNTGVISADTPSVGTGRANLQATGFNDQAVFFGGYTLPTAPSGVLTTVNVVSNTGVVASDSPAVSGVTARVSGAGSNYGGDKAIFAFGANTPAGAATMLNVSNLISNTGVISADTPGVGTARNQNSGAGYSLTA